MKTTKIIIAGLAVLFAAACAKEAPLAQKNSTIAPKTFTASVSNTGKTILKDAGKIAWAEGDVITVYDAAGNSDTYTATAEDNDKASIKLVLDLGDGPYCAVESRTGAKCAYNGSNGFDIDNICIADGAFGTADVLVASSATTDLTFSHATGWLRFQTAKQTSTVHLAFNKLAMGHYTAVFSAPGEEPAISAVSGKTHCDTSFVRQSTDYIIPVIPGTYKFSIVLEANDGKYSVDATKDMVVGRGQIINLGNIDSRLTKLKFYESFDQCKDVCGNDGNFAAGGSTVALITDNEGWSFTKGSCRKACMSYGSSSVGGSAVSPALGASGSATIKVRIAPYGNAKDYTSKTLDISIEGDGKLSSSTITVPSFSDINSITWTEFTFSAESLSATDKLKISSSEVKNNRFFLDEVKVF